MGTDTVEALRLRLETVQRRGREARAAEARILREMQAADRRRETQMLCTLGRAMLTMGERSPAFLEQARNFLSGYITREVDREVLVGTPFKLAATPANAVNPEGGKQQAKVTATTEQIKGDDNGYAN